MGGWKQLHKQVNGLHPSKCGRIPQRWHDCPTSCDMPCRKFWFRVGSSTPVQVCQVWKQPHTRKWWQVWEQPHVQVEEGHERRHVKPHTLKTSPPLDGLRGPWRDPETPARGSVGSNSPITDWPNAV